MSDNIAFRNWLFAFVATTIAVVGCIAYVDRPVAEFFDGHLRHTTTWVWLDRALAPLDLAVVTALLFLFSCGIWVMSGRLLSSWTRKPLLCSWAAMWATAADIILKHIFGRACPDPTYIQNHLYGFRLLHGGPPWQSFPSGTRGDLRCNRVGSLDSDTALAGDWCVDCRPAVRRSGHHQLPLGWERDRWDISGYVHRLHDGSAGSTRSARLIP